MFFVRVFFFSFQKNFFSWYGRTGSLLKTHTHVVLTTILLQLYFIFFLAGTIDSLNRTRGKQNLHDWYVCFHVVIVINIEKSCRDLSHTRGKLTICMHAQVWTLFHVTNQQSGRNQVVGNHHNHHKKLRPASTVLSSNHSLLTFPRAYKAKLTCY